MRLPSPHCLLVSAALGGLAGLVHAAPPSASPGPGLHATIREAAARVEQDFKTPGLEKKVTTILAARAPAAPAKPSGTARILKALRMPAGLLEINYTMNGLSLRGFYPDGSPDGLSAVFRELQRTQAQGMDETARLFELWHIANTLKSYSSANSPWVERTADLGPQAVKAARAWLADHHEDAAAHAMLAETLIAEPDPDPAERLAAVEAALKLDPQCARAQLLLISMTAAHLRGTLVPEGSAEPGQKPVEWDSFLRTLYRKAPSDANLAAFEAYAAEITRAVDQFAMDHPAETALRLRSISILSGIPVLREIARHARDGGSRNFEEFSAAVQRLESPTSKALAFHDRIPSIIATAVDDGQLIAALATFQLTGSISTAASRSVTWNDLPEKQRLPFDDAVEHAARLGLKDGSTAAAKACEAVASIESLASDLGRKPVHPDMAARAVRLDPSRHQALDLLMSQCVTEHKDMPAAHALSVVRLAVLPAYNSHHQSAATASKIQDWKTAQAELEACLKLRPGDFQCLHELIAVRLQQDQSPDRLKEAEERFAKAREIYSERSGALPADIVESFLHNLIVFLCLKKDKQTAAQILISVQGAGRLRPESIQELRTLLAD